MVLVISVVLFCMVIMICSSPMTNSIGGFNTFILHDVGSVIYSVSVYTSISVRGNVKS